MNELKIAEKEDKRNSITDTALSTKISKRSEMHLRIYRRYHNSGAAQMSQKGIKADRWSPVREGGRDGGRKGSAWSGVRVLLMPTVQPKSKALLLPHE
jgi:hypothetical protein